MSVGFYFALKGLTPDKYDEAVRQLAAAGAGAPKGRISHVALETNGEIQVFDIWESQEALEAFGTALFPVLTGLGVEPVAPSASRVHNVIAG
jgi:hypothetical protein